MAKAKKPMCPKHCCYYHNCGCTEPSSARSYVWTISRFDLEVEKDGEFTMVKKVPRGETQETIMTDDKNLFQGNCTIEKAQQFLDERYPNHLVISVRDNLS
jgi:5-methylcytosine-specific restriction endonuclease McrA